MLELPSPHVFGLHAVPHTAHNELPPSVEVFCSEPISSTTLRSLLDILPDQQLTVVQEREFVCNADFWIRSLAGPVYSLRNEYPVSTSLVMINEPATVEGLVRFELYVELFCWQTISHAPPIPDLPQLRTAFSAEEIVVARTSFGLD